MPEKTFNGRPCFLLFIRGNVFDFLGRYGWEGAQSRQMMVMA